MGGLHRLNQPALWGIDPHSQDGLLREISEPGHRARGQTTIRSKGQVWLQHIAIITSKIQHVHVITLLLVVTYEWNIEYFRIWKIYMYYDFLMTQVCRTYFFTGISESLSLQFMYIFTSTLTTSLSTYTMKWRI